MSNVDAVCVTGASGFIGSWVVKLLLEKGYKVKATVQDLVKEDLSFIVKGNNKQQGLDKGSNFLTETQNMSTRQALSNIRARVEILGGARKMDWRCFSDGKGRIFDEEEKAAENIYIKRMEKERLEKLRKKVEEEEKKKKEESTSKDKPSS